MTGTSVDKDKDDLINFIQAIKKLDEREQLIALVVLRAMRGEDPYANK